MCEQTEINYLDGDIVWVKLGACWWPGQVTGLHNLPEDIQIEFQRKPLIAAVKFFQEDTYEFVKNYQQIYKYNCTLKDEFIKKGLDKYRSKSKDGASYMDKFPGDVEMAEKLTGGDPDILNSEKFSPEERPDISALFGEKKIPKKKKERDDHFRRSTEMVRKITHPRFLRESDHEVRIRQQPSSLPSTPNAAVSPQYPCHLCNFTSSRVNVIICHIKSHRSGNSPVARSKVKTYSQRRLSESDTPKRKYVRKEKRQWKRKSEGNVETGKRKQAKQGDKANKKKKTDEEVRRTILADWDDDSDEELSLLQNNSVNSNDSISKSPVKSQSDMNDNEGDDKREDISDMPDASAMIAETERLLKDTEKLAASHILENSYTGTKKSNLSTFEKKSAIDKPSKASDAIKNKSEKKLQKDEELLHSDSESKNAEPEKDDKQARLSCFDFDEDDLPEPPLPPVRKMLRIFGEKKLSLKKEIIKEFEMSQALKTEQETDSDKTKTPEPVLDQSSNTKKSKESTAQDGNDKKPKSEDTHEEVVKPESSSTSKVPETKSNRTADEVSPAEGDQRKSNSNACETELEIVEIFEVEREEAEDERTVSVAKPTEKETPDDEVTDVNTNAVEKLPNKSAETVSNIKSTEADKKSGIDSVLTEGSDNASTKEMDETLSERFTTETEEDTVSESADTLPEQSEVSDVDPVDQDRLPVNLLSYEQTQSPEKVVKRRRGRPRKSLNSVDSKNITNKTPKPRDDRDGRKYGLTERSFESDSERSYSGRKRKPNKKYIESDIYVQDVDQRSFKTDESQSDNDEKLPEKQKPKVKRNRNSLGSGKKNVELYNKTAEGELELSDRLLDTAKSSTSKTELEEDTSGARKNDRVQLFDRSEKAFDEFTRLESAKLEQEPPETPPATENTNSITDFSKMSIEDALTEPVQTKSNVSATASEKKDETLSEKETVTGTDKDMEESSANLIDKAESSRQAEPAKATVEMLPPKKSQIKKFELSQNDFFDTESTASKATDSDSEKKTVPEKEKAVEVEAISSCTDPKIVEGESTDKTVKETPKDTVPEIVLKDEVLEPAKPQESQVKDAKEKSQTETKTVEDHVADSKRNKAENEGVKEKKTDEQGSSSKRAPIQTRYKGKFTPETGAKSKRDRDLFTDEKPVNTFQEAFLKTLQMDKKKEEEDAEAAKIKKGKRLAKKKAENQDNVNTAATPVSDSLGEVAKMTDTVPNVLIQETLPDASDMSNFEAVEVVVEQNVVIDPKVENILSTGHELASSNDLVGDSKTQSQSNQENVVKSVTMDTQKLDESLRVPSSTPPSSSSDINVPVKKREKPRIIENVTLTEPMQILKSKLLDKLPQKGMKHKLEQDVAKKTDQKGSPKTKIMKIESLPSGSKLRTGLKVTSPHLSLTKKLQVLKAEEAETAAIMEAQNEKLTPQTSQNLATSSGTEKCIQQSSQSLADMELDINSMPFVLSEDVLTPESIEQMPVVISSIIPASSSVPATIAFTPTTQIVTTNQSQFQHATDNTTEASSPTKKKSGTPAILKAKNKAKPTITSIKTLVPPLTGGVKGLKFQSAQPGKSPQLLTQKGSTGKYVVVQTSGGQQLRYSVQGKTTTPQKIAIPAGKSTGNAQVVQQGSKVVILTSAQSGQTNKILPLNISKTLGGKVQKIMTSRGQVFYPISPENIISSKTVIAPKGDASATTSKLSPGHKIINTQGIITSKALLTPIPGTITKTALLGTLSQGILTKDGIYTPISASALSGKTIIDISNQGCSKTLVTKGATILSSQNLGSSKAILTPISQAISAKTILNTQGVNTRATVLTPITGQQVKAIAAKSPTKGKVQYQSIQQKVQFPMIQKSQKVPISSSLPSRGTGSLKSAGSTLVFQNTGSGSKAVPQGKKIIKQVVQQGTGVQSLSSTSGTIQQTINVLPQQKGKTVSKVIIPRGNARQTKAQQKIVVQKVQEQPVPVVQNVQPKQTTSASLNNVTTVTKAAQLKQSGSTVVKGTARAQAINKNAQQKNLLNIAMNSVATAVTTASTSVSTPLSLPPLEPIESEKKLKKDTAVETVQKEQPKSEKLSAEKRPEGEKVEEAKIPAAQPQIMALPTESSDGTQTYVLVTIDEQGQIQPLDNNTLMSLEGTTQNPDGTRTLYIDPSSLGESGTLDNIVLQFDNSVLPNVQTNVSETNQTIISEGFPSSEIIQTSNQDILAAALANTDFQQEISLPDNPAGSVMTTGLTQTSLINQTILQSTIIPPTEPISSPSVLETSLTLNQPIMTPLEVPSNLPIQSESTSTSVVSTIPSSLELPITITNPNISYISAGEAQIQIPGNSMPDIGEIMENTAGTEMAQTEIPASTQYLVIPSLEENIAVATQDAQSGDISTVTYSVSIPSNIVLENAPVQTTPSMPIIDDTYSENVTEQSFVDVPVSEMLVSKAPTVSEVNAQTQDTTVTSEMAISTSDVPSQKIVMCKAQIPSDTQEVQMPLEEAYSSQEVPATDPQLSLQQTIAKESVPSTQSKVSNQDSSVSMEIVEQTIEPMTSSMPIIDETSLVTSETNMPSVGHMNLEETDSSAIDTTQEAEAVEKFHELTFKEQSNVSSPAAEEQTASTNRREQEQSTMLTATSLDRMNEDSMEVDAAESKMYSERVKDSDDYQRDEPSSQAETENPRGNIELHFEETNAEASQEAPSQSYDQVNPVVDSIDLPSQSAKSENSREPSQSINYEPMETDEDTVTAEPPTQSFEHAKLNEASQSYEASAETSTNAPTQSFNEERTNEAIDDQSFPTQSYEVGKPENLPENLETDAEISQEGNIPSQSNDIGTDGIGTSSVSTNNSGLNEDETASSSYVPETPENQERDQDQESAISTSSYEIPPCEELNIASSSVIPDTSVRTEHAAIDDNGIPEIPTSSYNLNPDITSTHVDSVPTSSYEDQVIVEQNVSTSYEVPISMPGLEETSSQNFVTESTDHRNEPSSYYAHHQEVTASYYDSVHQESNSRIEDQQEEVTPSYYEGNPQEASQSYFPTEEATPSYSSQMSPSYYDPRPESEASQSYYSDLEKSEQSSSQNIEASQSFYQERTDELRLGQQGEATPTYSERYSVDYTLDNSPIERHDLVESSVPATRPTER